MLKINVSVILLLFYLRAKFNRGGKTARNVITYLRKVVIIMMVMTLVVVITSLMKTMMTMMIMMRMRITSSTLSAAWRRIPFAVIPRFLRIRFFEQII